MMKSLLALAVLGAIAGTATAQTSVTMYGIADVGFVHESGSPAGSVNKITSGVSAGSRLGFRGVEDLGGGLAALFTIETGVNLDTGNFAQGASVANPAGIAFGRQSFVGLKGPAGTVTMGRQYNPYFISINLADPFGSGQVGNAGNLMAFTGAAGRSSNSIQYVSPTFSGFRGEVLYAFGEERGNSTRRSVINGAVMYAEGPLLARVAYNRTYRGTGAIDDSARNTIFMMNYNFGVAKLHTAYATIKGPSLLPTLPGAELVGFNAAAGAPLRPVPSNAFIAANRSDARDFLIGATVPIGPGNLLASYIHHKDRTDLAQDADQLAIGYEYFLSKRTALYTAYSRMNNKNGAGYTVGSSAETGSGDRAVSLGMRHTF